MRKCKRWHPSDRATKPASVLPCRKAHFLAAAAYLQIRSGADDDGDDRLLGVSTWRALRHASRALALRPPGRARDADAALLHTRAQRSVLEPWHVDMMNDLERNRAYDRAIAAAVESRLRALRGPPAATAGVHDDGGASPPSRPLVVLDLGAGAGLLSLMVARAAVSAVAGATTPAVNSTATKRGHGEAAANASLELSSWIRIFAVEADPALAEVRFSGC